MIAWRAGLALCSALLLAGVPVPLLAQESAAEESVVIYGGHPLRPPIDPAKLPVVPLPAEALTLDALERDRPTLMFVEYRQPAKYIGEPKICPGSSREEDQADIICMAELYQGPAERLRHLSGPRLTRNMRLRTTAHSMYIFLRPGNLLLVAARPFEDQGTTGVFAHWWTMADDDGRFCLREDELAEMGVEKIWGRAKLREDRGPWLDSPVRYRCLKP